MLLGVLLVMLVFGKPKPQTPPKPTEKLAQRTLEAKEPGGKQQTSSTPMVGHAKEKQNKKKVQEASN